MNQKPPLFNIEFVRNQFPALSTDFVFMDNAGGTQILGAVMDRVQDFYKNYFVQLGGSYKVSAEADEKLEQVTKELAEYINARDSREVVVGSSTTMLLRILSICISQQWQEGDEVIISNSEHEANASCWKKKQKNGIVVKVWKVNPETLELDIDDLNKLLTEKTKLVALVHASNILGTINPVKQIAEVVHAAGALICVDGVAYAPHRLIDVQEFGVDFYVFSTYKVYGPHQSILYGRYEVLSKLDGLNHYFIGKDEVPYKFQPGNINFELTYSLGGIMQYLHKFYDHHFPGNEDLTNREKLAKSFDLIASHEQVLANRMIDYLKSKKQIKIIGVGSGDKNKRMPTISFVHDDYKSSEVVEKVDQYQIGIRWGDFYAKKIIHDLGLEANDGVIRVSLVHYNTMDEVEKLISAFEDIFKR